MTHTRKVTLFLVLAMIAMLTVGGLCFGAEKYPTKPIQLIVPYAPGGSSDVLARTVEKAWKKYSPQPMIVVNKAGAGGVLGTEYVVRSKPDGYTLLFAYGSGCDLVMPHLQQKLKLGSIHVPDAGFLPFLCGAGLAILGIVWVLMLQWTKERENEGPAEKRLWHRPLLSLILMVLYGWAMETVGYITSTLIFIVSLAADH